MKKFPCSWQLPPSKVCISFDIVPLIRQQQPKGDLAALLFINLVFVFCLCCKGIISANKIVSGFLYLTELCSETQEIKRTKDILFPVSI